MRLVCYIFFCAQVFRVIKSVSFSYLILFEKENYYDEILAFYDEKLKSIKSDGILMLMKSLICISNYERFGFEILHFVGECMWPNYTRVFFVWQVFWDGLQCLNSKKFFMVMILLVVSPFFLVSSKNTFRSCYRTKVKKGVVLKFSLSKWRVPKLVQSAFPHSNRFLKGILTNF